MRGRSRKGPNPLTRSYESNGPDVKIRGTALHIAEKYAQLARDAQASGDRVHSENLLQHAEHYFRIVAAAQAQMPQPQQNFRSEGDGGDGGDEEEYRGNGHDRQQGRPDGQPDRQGDDQPAFGLSDPQPFVNGSGEDRSEGEATSGPEETQPEQTARDQGDNGGGRSRRRRPYRDRSGDQNNPQAGAAPQAEEVAEAPAGDD
jgi:Domain of unknown function (DUF4167)